MHLLNGDSTVEEYQEEIITPPPEPGWSVAMSREREEECEKDPIHKGRRDEVESQMR